MDSSPNEWKKLDTRRTFCMKHKNRHISLQCSCARRIAWKGAQEKLLGSWQCSIRFCVVVTWMYTIFKIHRAEHLRSVDIIVLNGISEKDKWMLLIALSLFQQIISSQHRRPLGELNTIHSCPGCSSSSTTPAFYGPSKLSICCCLVPLHSHDSDPLSSLQLFLLLPLSLLLLASEFPTSLSFRQNEEDKTSELAFYLAPLLVWLLVSHHLRSLCSPYIKHIELPLSEPISFLFPVFLRYTWQSTVEV